MITEREQSDSRSTESDQLITDGDTGAGRLPEHMWVRFHDRQGIQRKLRISLVDRCNLSCFFCHNEGQGAIKNTSNLALDPADLGAIVRIAVSEGVNSVKLTGGEPLLYRTPSGDVLDVVGRIAAVRRSTRSFDLSMTTNGTLLPRLARRLAAAGLDRVTVSLTTMSPATFGEFISARTHLLERMIVGVDEARAAGLRPIKLNVPLYYSSSRHRGNLFEIDNLVGFASGRGISEVRFFTLISHDNFSDFEEYYHFFSPEMRASLIRCLSHYGWDSPADTVDTLARLGSTHACQAYPKVEFGIDLGQVRVAFEAMKYGRLGYGPGQQEGPYAMRLGADGSLRTVLNGSPDYRLIDAVQAGAPDERLREIYRAAQEAIP